MRHAFQAKQGGVKVPKVGVSQHPLLEGSRHQLCSAGFLKLEAIVTQRCSRKDDEQLPGSNND
jgi:hypothetical protein